MLDGAHDETLHDDGHEGADAARVEMAGRILFAQPSWQRLGRSVRSRKAGLSS
jgi:hypothetical protein